MSNTPISTLPHLTSRGTDARLIVDGQPFLIRGGELGNSSGERAYLSDYWPHLETLGLNTLLAAVYWDAIEPVEGVFDWSTVDELLEDARAHGMRLVLLWFGSWKNSMSSYVPAWVKTDLARFPRVRTSSDKAMEILSPFYQSNRDADAKAFAALMAHLREVDPQHTVIMVQVENEIGMIPEARDHTAAAEATWAQPVPAALIEYLSARHPAAHALAPSPDSSRGFETVVPPFSFETLSSSTQATDGTTATPPSVEEPHRGVSKPRHNPLDPQLAAQWAMHGFRTSGTWSEVFGDSVATEELFQAWAFAQYVDAVAAAGRAELDLPMFTNAALIRTGTQPGQYPSAGPLPHLADIWRAGAPHLDFISPDIYFPNFAEWADKYVVSGNPLFVPEALRSVDAAANAIYSFGKHGALGFAPFGIESISGNAASMLAGAYGIIRQLTPYIAAATADRSPQGSTLGFPTAPTMTAFLPPTDDQRAPHRIRVGDLDLEATYERVPAPTLADGVINESGQASGSEKLPAAAIAIQTGPDEYLIGGIGTTLTFHHPIRDHETIGIISAEEGSFDEAGTWQHRRWLNGDQTHQGRHIRLEPGRFALQKVKLYRYK